MRRMTRKATVVNKQRADKNVLKGKLKDIDRKTEINNVFAKSHSFLIKCNNGIAKR